MSRVSSVSNYVRSVWSLELRSVVLSTRESRVGLGLGSDYCWFYAAYNRNLFNEVNWTMTFIPNNIKALVPCIYQLVDWCLAKQSAEYCSLSSHTSFT